MLPLLAVHVLLAAHGVSSSVTGKVLGSGGLRLPLANVSCVVGGRVLSVNTNAEGAYTLPEASAHCDIWARQYESVHGVAAGSTVHLPARPIPGFPARDWVFEGWAVEAQSSNVPATKIAFLAHPSAYRPPSGDRVFLTSTANAHAGPGWTQGYWQTDSAVRATALPTALVNRSNPAMLGTAFTARMVVADGRLLMLIGMARGINNGVSLLENKNLADPSDPTGWVPAEGNGTITIDWTGAPTTAHEDYRYHHFDQGEETPSFVLESRNVRKRDIHS